MKLLRYRQPTLHLRILTPLVLEHTKGTRAGTIKGLIAETGLYIETVTTKHMDLETLFCTMKVPMMEEGKTGWYVLNNSSKLVENFSITPVQ